MQKRYLILEDGTIFQGWAFGADREAVGELVFTTNLVGYVETLTDPSYCGQIVMQTFFMGDRQRFDTVDHINNRERFDNSIYNLRWADKDTQYGNRRDNPGKHRMVMCIGDEDEIFFSCREVERLYGLPPNSVGKVCRGELESICGYRFCYL